jgi:hypothetical protein
MDVSLPLLNEYYIYLKSDEKPIFWNIYDKNPEVDMNLKVYIGKVLQGMEKNLKVSGLVVYVTWSVIDKLPSYGQNVVVIILGEEWYRIPKYAHKVGAIFKCVGTKPILGCNPLLKPSLLNFLTLIQYLRILLVRIPGIVNYQFHKLKNFLFGTGKVAPIYDIPLGYNNSIPLPIKNFQERPIDAYFSGSVVHVPYPIWSFKRWLGTPKMLSRKLMLLSVNHVQEKNPDLKMELSTTTGFHSRTCEQANSYPHSIMNTKVCLVPRGTSFETSRLFEAMKYGCIIVTESLPYRWYLDGAPVIKINDWQNLKGVLDNLFSNQELMQELHQETLNWWNYKCSESVVGTYIARELNALRRASILMQ